jgi:hypothetical protein
MPLIINVCQVVVALGIFNVWLLRFRKPTSWRGGNARNLREEFEVYGLPGWFMALIGFLKLLFAASLIAGIWYPLLTEPAAIGMSILMLGAILMHFKVKDPLKKSLPALTMFVLSVVIVFFG